MTSSPAPTAGGLCQHSLRRVQEDSGVSAAEATASDSGADARLLVVDDSLTVRMSLRDVFVRHGYDVVLAEGGEEAVEILRSQKIDVMILDLIMPHKNGIAVLCEIKKDQTLRSIPILLLTAVADRRELVECLDLGADDFIVKPWDERELLGRVRSMVRLRQFQSALLASEERFRSISTAAQDAIIVMDEHGQVAYWNPAAETIFGYTEEEALGASVHALLAPARLREAYLLGLPRFRATGEGATVGRTIERVAVRKNGDEFPMEISVSAVQNKGQWHAVGIVRDITERKQAETERERLQEQLVVSSRRAGMAEVATNVLHNVGNVLNSVNVSANLMVEKVKKSRVSDLAKVSALVDQHTGDLAAFITSDRQGRHLPKYLNQLAGRLAGEFDSLLAELGALIQNVDHIKEIVSTQQSYAAFSGMVEPTDLTDVVQNALSISEAALARHGVGVKHEFHLVPEVATDKHKVLRILVNLINNAKCAASESAREDKQVTIRVRTADDGRVRIEVEDNGIGIPKENLTKVFQHGFTTKKDGHGFGLHSSAVAAKELGGSLAVHSDGPGQGAMFTLEIPTTAAPQAGGDRRKSSPESPDVCLGEVAV